MYLSSMDAVFAAVGLRNNTLDGAFGSHTITRFYRGFYSSQIIVLGPLIAWYTSAEIQLLLRKLDSANPDIAASSFQRLVEEYNPYLLEKQSMDALFIEIQLIICSLDSQATPF
jgi:hypothetical protein